MYTPLSPMVCTNHQIRNIEINDEKGEKRYKKKISSSDAWNENEWSSKPICNWVDHIHPKQTRLSEKRWSLGAQCQSFPIPFLWVSSWKRMNQIKLHHLLYFQCTSSQFTLSNFVYVRTFVLISVSHWCFSNYT